MTLNASSWPILNSVPGGNSVGWLAGSLRLLMYVPFFELKSSIVNWLFIILNLKCCPEIYCLDSNSNFELNQPLPMFFSYGASTTCSLLMCISIRLSSMDESLLATTVDLPLDGKFTLGSLPSHSILIWHCSIWDFSLGFFFFQSLYLSWDSR